MISIMALSKEASLALEGLWKPVILRTNWSAAAATSFSVMGGSKLNSGLMFRHIGLVFTLTNAFYVEESVTPEPACLDGREFSILPRCAAIWLFGASCVSCPGAACKSADTPPRPIFCNQSHSCPIRRFEARRDVRWRAVLPISRYIGTLVAASRGSDFPEARRRHVFEIGAGGAPLRTMEDRLAGDEFVQDSSGFGIGVHQARIISADTPNPLRCTEGCWQKENK